MAFPSAIGCFVVGHSPIFTGGPCLPVSPTMLQKTIMSYLYWQYRDDDDLQAFVDAYNGLTQEFVDWFNALNLPIYTKDPVSGAMLDWVAFGLYGLRRPVLGAGQDQEEGPYNTYAYDELAYDELIKISAKTFTRVTDDIFRRIITWHFLKGDGKVFSVRWLKRRVMRFLTGEDGTNPNIDQTYPISVSFGYQGQVNIILVTFNTVVNSGAFYDTFAYDEMSYGELNTTATRIRNQFAMAQVFKEAMDQGALEFPFQYSAVVQVQP